MKRKVIDILNDYLVLRDMGDSYLMHYISEQDGMRYGNKISVRKDSPLEVNDTWEETPQRGAGLYQAWCVHPLSDIEDKKKDVFIGLLQGIILHDTQPIGNIHIWKEKIDGVVYVRGHVRVESTKIDNIRYDNDREHKS